MDTKQRDDDMTNTDRCGQIIAEAKFEALKSGQNSSVRVANFSIGWIANKLARAEERIEALTPALLRRQAE